jgi:carboxymethylenebutenolidase
VALRQPDLELIAGRLNQALTAAGKPSEIVVYPEAGHAFLADYRPRYRAEDAAAGWAACLAWFHEHGVG